MSSDNDIETSSRSSGTIGRAFTVLEALRSLGGSATLSTLSQRSGLPKTTVHRILAALVSCGAVHRGHDAYTVGKLVRDLVDPTYTDRAALRRTLKPLLLDLYESTRHAASIAVLHELHVLYIDTVFSQPHRAIITQTAECAPPYCTAAGKALLAHDPVAAARFMTEPQFARFTRWTITSPVDLESDLVSTRERGLAISRSEYVPGTIAIAAPVIGQPGGLIAALTVGGHEDHFDEHHVAESLRRASYAARRHVRALR